MALKGQKFKTFTNEERTEIVNKYMSGKYSYVILAKEYNIPVSTIKTWKMKIDHPDKYLGNGQKRGRPKEKELTKEDWNERYEILKKYQAFLKAQRERK